MSRYCKMPKGRTRSVNMLQEVKGHQQRDSRRQRMQEELQKSRWIFGRRLLARLEIGNELRCREATEAAVVVIKVVDKYEMGKDISKRGGC